MDRRTSTQTVDSNPFRSRHLSEGRGESSTGSKVDASELSSLTHRTNSSTPKETELYQQMIAPFLNTIDVNDRKPVREAIQKVRIYFGNKIKKIHSAQNELLEDRSPNDPDYMKNSRRIKKLEKLVDDWVKQLQSVSARLRKIEMDNDTIQLTEGTDVANFNDFDGEILENPVNQWLESTPIPVQPSAESEIPVTSGQTAEKRDNLDYSFISFDEVPDNSQQNVFNQENQPTITGRNPTNAGLKYELNLAEFNRKKKLNIPSKPMSIDSFKVFTDKNKYEIKFKNAKEKLMPYKGILIENHKNALTLQSENLRLQKALQDSERKVTRVCEVNDQLRQKLAEKESEIDKEIREIQLEKSSNMAQILRLSKDLKSANEHFMTRECELENLRTEIARTKEENKILIGEKTKLKQENEKLSADVSQYLKEITDLVGRNPVDCELQSELDRCKNENSSLFNDMIKLKQENEKLMKQNYELTERLRESEQKTLFNTDSPNKSSSYEEDIDFKSEKKRLTERISDLKSRNKILSEINQELKDQKNELKSEVSNLKLQNDFINKELNESRKKVDNYVRINDNLKDKKRRLKERLSEAGIPPDKNWFSQVNNQNQSTNTNLDGSSAGNIAETNTSSGHNPFFPPSFGTTQVQNPFQFGTTTTTASNTQTTNVPPVNSSNTAQSTGQPVVMQKGPATKPSFPKFYGDFEGALQWYRKFQLVADHYQLPDDEKVKYVRLNLFGSALDWYNITFIPVQDSDLIPYQTDPIPGWEEFSTEFFKEYRPKGIEISLRKKLQNIYKFSEESYMTYFRRVICLIREITSKMTEDEQIMYVRDGLKRDPIHSHIKTTASIEDMKLIFLNWDKSSIITKPMNRFPDKRPDVTEEKPVIKPKTSKPKVLTGQNSKVPNIECLNCRKMGHFWRNCSEPLLDRKTLDERLAEKRAQRSGEFFTRKAKEPGQNIVAAAQEFEEDWEKHLTECLFFAPTQTEDFPDGNYSASYISMGNTQPSGQSEEY